MDSTGRASVALGGDVNVPADAWLLAGSIVDLPEATDFEVKLTLVDEAGGKTEKLLRNRLGITSRFR